MIEEEEVERKVKVAGGLVFLAARTKRKTFISFIALTVRQLFFSIYKTLASVY